MSIGERRKEVSEKEEGESWRRKNIFHTTQKENEFEDPEEEISEEFFR